MEDALRAGIAVYNDGEFHAAHDAWEDRWLGLESGSDEERLLHGLIQFTAAVFHARNRNWSGAAGLAASAVEYLEALPPDYRGVNVEAVRAYLRRLGADPEYVERERPLPLTHEGEAVGLSDLDFEAAALAAGVLAGEYDRFDATVVDRAVAFAREELAGGVRTRFIALVMDFAADAAHRDLVYRRLAAHVEERERRERDVDGLFDPE